MGAPFAPFRPRPLLAAVLVLALVAPGAHAQPPGQELTPEQVLCNELQLERLLGRLAASGPMPSILVSYSDDGALYDGLLVANQHALGETLVPEHHLAFHLNPTIRDLLVNPRRPPLGQVALTREQSASTLVDPGDPGFLELSANPTLMADPPAEGLLRINNLRSPEGALAASTLPGRGLALDGLLTPCHDRFTIFDRRMFALLQRLVRAQAVLALPPSAFIESSLDVAIFRGEAPGVYRLNAYGSPGPPALAVELEVEADVAGRLLRGTLRMLPPCTAEGERGCSALSPPAAGDQVYTLRLIRPLFAPNELWQPGDPGTGAVTWDEEFPPDELPSVVLDLGLLLRDSTWNRPLP